MRVKSNERNKEGGRERETGNTPEGLRGGKRHTEMRTKRWRKIKQ